MHCMGGDLAAGRYLIADVALVVRVDRRLARRRKRRCPLVSLCPRSNHMAGTCS